MQNGFQLLVDSCDINREGNLWSFCNIQHIKKIKVLKVAINLKYNLQ